MGDVLRSTALLPPLAEVHPRAAITWITRKESVPLLQRNPYVAEVLELGPEALAHLQTRTFDRVINLDASKTSAALATAARSMRKDGFVLDERGLVQPTNEAAQRWLEAGIFDDIKRQGTETYQDRMADILGLSRPRAPVCVRAGDDERARAKGHLESIGLDDGPAGDRAEYRRRRTLAVEAVAGGRLCRAGPALSADQNVQFLLLGGPPENRTQRTTEARVRRPPARSGLRQPVRHFGGLAEPLRCRRDRRHAGDASRARAEEADRRPFRTDERRGNRALWAGGEGRARHGVPELLQDSCDFVPNCMDLISMDMVERAVLNQLEIATALRANPLAIS